MQILYKSKDVVNYLGLYVIKALQPSALYRFKKITEKNIRDFRYDKIIGDALSEDEIRSIEDQYFGGGLCKALVGRSSFAESFLTSEWLYDSFKTAGKIDYTVVALGYFKSIEQLMWDYIQLHKNEGRSLKRGFVKNDEKYCTIDDKGNKKFDQYVPINQENIDDERLDTTIGAMVNSFFCFSGNKDLEREDLEFSTLAYVRRKMKEIVPLRNGYFHKHNLDEWEKVEEARRFAYLISYLLLGCYKITDEDKIELTIEMEEANDYTKLCEYINDHPRKVYYLYGEGKEEAAPYSCSVDISYNKYGEREYGNIYTHLLATKDDYTITKENMPYKIESADLNIEEVFDGQRFDFERLLNKERELIFEGGKFLSSEKYHIGEY